MKRVFVRLEITKSTAHLSHFALDLRMIPIYFDFEDIGMGDREAPLRSVHRPSREAFRRSINIH